MKKDIWKEERTDVPPAMRALAAALFIKIAVSNDGYGYQMHGGHGEEGTFLKRIPRQDFEWIMKRKTRYLDYSVPDFPDSPAVKELQDRFIELSFDDDFSKEELRACGRIIVVRRKKQNVTEKNGWINLKLTPREVAYYFVKTSKVIKKTTICTNAIEGRIVARILGLQHVSFKKCPF